MNIKAGDAVVLKDWEELNHDGVSWYGISKETYNELKMRVRVIEKIDVSYAIEDDCGIPFYITDEAIKKYWNKFFNNL